MADPQSDPDTRPPDAAADLTSANDQSTAESKAASSHQVATPRQSGGPLNLEQIRKLRESQGTNSAPLQSRRQRPHPGTNRDGAPTGGGPSGGAPSDGAMQSTATSSNNATSAPEKIDDEAVADRYRSNNDSSPAIASKVAIPNSRIRSEDEDLELEQALGGADLDGLMIGDKSIRGGERLESGARHQGKVLKIHNANVFVSLGGPNEGVVPLLQFTDMPVEGQSLDCVIRAFNTEEGLYELAIPGEAISANDWSDLEEGAIVEVKVESANTGGVECKVGIVRGFIPISQLSEYRIESAADYIGQKLLCVVTEANPRRGNLVLSHRAVLEREKEQKRKERLEKIEVGEKCEGIVRKVTDFGAFVDIGGLDGLIHISQLSWDKIKHPSEVVKEGDTIQVRVEKIDPKTGKIALSYRSLQDDPWNDVEARFPIGSNVNGTISRLANFGAFVRLATGIEGLIHISELAHRRINNVSQVVNEGQDVEVKIVSVDRNAQRIGLSLRATQARPESAGGKERPAPVEEPKRESAVRKYEGQLRGGTGSNSAGDLFGLKF